MADWQPDTRVTGKYYTYTIYVNSKFFGREFLVKREDGKSFGIYQSKADALRKAEKEAGPSAHIR